MKKLLGILGTITIAGSGMVGLVGNAPVSTKNEINYQQTNNLETLDRNKRGFNDNRDEIESSDFNYYASFRPNLFRQIQQYHDNNLWNYYNYENLFVNRMYNGVWMSSAVESSRNRINVKAIAAQIWDNWDTIVSHWNNSDQKHRIRIVFEIKGEDLAVNNLFFDGARRKLYYSSTNIRTDERNY